MQPLGALAHPDRAGDRGCRPAATGIRTVTDPEALVEVTKLTVSSSARPRLEVLRRRGPTERPRGRHRRARGGHPRAGSPRRLERVDVGAQPADRVGGRARGRAVVEVADDGVPAAGVDVRPALGQARLVADDGGGDEVLALRVDLLGQVDGAHGPEVGGVDRCVRPGTSTAGLLTGPAADADGAAEGQRSRPRQPRRRGGSG